MSDIARQTPNANLPPRKRLTDEELNQAITALALDLPGWHVSYARTDRGSVRITVDGPDGVRKVRQANA